MIRSYHTSTFSRALNYPSKPVFFIKIAAFLTHLGDVSIDFVVISLSGCCFSSFLHVSFLSARKILHIDNMRWTVFSPPPHRSLPLASTPGTLRSQRNFLNPRLPVLRPFCSPLCISWTSLVGAPCSCRKCLPFVSVYQFLFQSAVTDRARMIFAHYWSVGRSRGVSISTNPWLCFRTALRPVMRLVSLSSFRYKQSVPIRWLWHSSSFFFLQNPMSIS